MVLQVFMINDYFIDTCPKSMIAYDKKIFSYSKSFSLTVYIISIDKKQLGIGAEEIISMPKRINIDAEELFNGPKDIDKAIQEFISSSKDLSKGVKEFSRGLKGSGKAKKGAFGGARKQFTFAPD